MDREPTKNVQRKQLPSERHCVFILPRIYDFSLFSSFFSKLKLLDIDDVDKTMDKINKQTQNMQQIQEILGTTLGAAADFD
ncbi:putative Snf7 family protein [Helianthus debilis subsp. tardiflorus]